MLSNTWDNAFHTKKLQNTSALRAALVRDLNIGDFISTAMYAWRVSDVVWLRSDFRRGEYNGPLPGKYEVGLGRSKLSFEDYTEDDDILCFKSLRTTYLAPNDTTSNRLMDPFEACEEVNAPFEPRVVNVTVATMRHLLPQQNMFPLPLLAHRKWILDIDLDFFTSSDPCLALFAHHGYVSTVLL